MASNNNDLKKRTKFVTCLFQAIKMSWGQKFWLEIKFWPADESTMQNRERPNRCQNSGNILIEATLMYGKQL